MLGLRLALRAKAPGTRGYGLRKSARPLLTRPPRGLREAPRRSFPLGGRGPRLFYRCLRKPYLSLSVLPTDLPPTHTLLQLPMEHERPHISRAHGDVEQGVSRTCDAFADSDRRME